MWIGNFIANALTVCVRCAWLDFLLCGKWANFAGQRNNTLCGGGLVRSNCVMFVSPRDPLNHRQIGDKNAKSSVEMVSLRLKLFVFVSKIFPNFSQFFPSLVFFHFIFFPSIIDVLQPILHMPHSVHTHKRRKIRRQKSKSHDKFQHRHNDSCHTAISASIATILSFSTSLRNFLVYFTKWNWNYHDLSQTDTPQQQMPMELFCFPLCPAKQIDSKHEPLYKTFQQITIEK